MSRKLLETPESFDPINDDKLREYLREMEWHPNQFTHLDEFIRKLVNRKYSERMKHERRTNDKSV